MDRREDWMHRAVLKLRADYEGGTPAAAEKYLDLSYYQRALAGR